MSKLRLSMLHLRKINNHRKFSLLLIVILMILGFLFLQSMIFRQSQSLAGLGVVKYWAKIPGSQDMSRKGFPQFEERDVDDHLGRESVHNQRLNGMPKGIFLSKLRQQQAKLVRRNYEAMSHPNVIYPFDTSQRLRKNVVANVCSSFEENVFGPKLPVPGHLLVDDNHHLIFCQVRKVASITWRQVLDEAVSKAGGLKIRRLNTYNQSERTYRLQRYNKIMFVREPILRAISGWYDKFVNVSDRDLTEYVLRYGCDIARRSHKNTIKNSLCNREARENYAGDGGQGEAESFLKAARELAISFEDFAHYLINGPVSIKNDMHWQTYHSRCQPCRILYDFIGHYETMTTDAEEIMRHVGLSYAMPNFPRKSSGSEKIALEVLADLDPLLLMRLSELYHMDYQLFGYNLRKLQDLVLRHKEKEALRLQN